MLDFPRAVYQGIINAPICVWMLVALAIIGLMWPRRRS